MTEEWLKELAKQLEKPKRKKRVIELLVDGQKLVMGRSLSVPRGKGEK